MWPETWFILSLSIVDLKNKTKKKKAYNIIRREFILSATPSVCSRGQRSSHKKKKKTALVLQCVGGNTNQSCWFPAGHQGSYVCPSRSCVGRKQMHIFFFPLRYKQNRKQLLQQRRAVFPALYLCCSPLVAGLTESHLFTGARKK